MTEPAARFDAKLLYRRLDRLFGSLDPSRPQRELLSAFLEQGFLALSEDLRLRGGLLYGEQREDFSLLKRVGHEEGPAAEAFDKGAPPLSQLFQHGVYIFEAEADGSPGRLGLLPPGASAACLLGRRPHRHVLFFLLDEGWTREELDFALNTIRAALGARLMDERVRGSMREAAEIQQSLLLEEPPSFPGYELACRSLAAEEVGGDFFDFLSFGDEMLGVAIGDASGHGLPAALLVRDVVTGLRMGIEKELNITHVFEKLNRVIHRSSLSSRFVSVFYGELEPNGNLLFVNAGHPPPLVVSPTGVEPLTTGGTVIGPLPEPRFRRGFAHLVPGSALVLATDGILERRGAEGELGTAGLARLVQEGLAGSAEQILEAVFTAAYDHGGGKPWEDDATAVVVKRASRG